VVHWKDARREARSLDTAQAFGDAMLVPIIGTPPEAIDDLSVTLTNHSITGVNVMMLIYINLPHCIKIALKYSPSTRVLLDSF
jgi:hypothetical protein